MGQHANVLTTSVRDFVAVLIQRIGGRQTEGTDSSLGVRVTYLLIAR